MIDKLHKWDFVPIPTTPGKVRKLLNHRIREANGDPEFACYDYEMVVNMHSLDLLCPTGVVLSSCKRFVAIAAHDCNIMLVEFWETVTEKSESYRLSPEMAKAVMDSDLSDEVKHNYRKRNGI